MGDKEQLKRVMAINKEAVDSGNPAPLLYNIFGHIHESWGVTQQKGMDTMFINASSVDLHYNANHKPIMFYMKGDRKAQPVL